MGFQITIENAGRVVPLTVYDPTGITRLTGAKGFGIAPTTVKLKKKAGTGSRFQGTSRDAREIDLPIVFFGEDPSEIEDKMRNLARVLQDDVSTAILAATYSDSTRWEIEVHYSGGADPVFGQDTDGKHYAKWFLTLSAPQPYFVSADARQYPLRLPTATAGLLPNLSQLHLSSSQAFGSIILNNGGDVPSQPIYQVRGPGTNFSVVHGITGKGFSYNHVIASGDIVTINTITKRVTNSAGDNMYKYLSTAPKLFALNAGDTPVTIALDGATTDSLISVTFREMRELIFG